MSQLPRPALQRGNHFEDFSIGQRFRHATPRTLTDGDASLGIALTGARQPLFSSQVLARKLGFRARPIDDILVFNIAFGKTVTDISINAIANLGYADVRFLAPVFPGDTLSAETEIIGLRETSDGKAGIVYVRSRACNQEADAVLEWVRWVLVRKREAGTAGIGEHVPHLPRDVAADRLAVPALTYDLAAVEAASGSSRFWDDYCIGERIDHDAGMTVDESDHTLATKLYQNNAKVHFDALAMKASAHGRRLVYGGHVISICRALAHDGLENALTILAINGGTHRAPTFAGDTLYCFTEVLDKVDLARSDCGALRLRLVGIRNCPAQGFVDRDSAGGTERVHPDVVLDLDYTVLMPRSMARTKGTTND